MSSELEELKKMANQLNVEGLQTLANRLERMSSSEHPRFSISEKEELINYCREKADFLEKKIDNFGALLLDTMKKKGIKKTAELVFG
ncbi:MAG: hypothetical protein AABW67_03910 [Nanoarchaeota archaeon]